GRPPRPRYPFGRAAHVHSGAVAAGDLRSDPAQHHGAAIERKDFAILRSTGGAGRADIVMAVGTALEVQLLQLGAVGEIHHDAAIPSAVDHDRLGALTAG